MYSPFEFPFLNTMKYTTFIIIALSIISIFKTYGKNYINIYIIIIYNN